MRKYQRIVSASIGAPLTIGLLILPTPVIGAPERVLIDHRYQVFLLIIGLWVILEAIASEQTQFQQGQRSGRWLPYLMSMAILLVFQASVIERALHQPTGWTIPAIIGSIVMITGILLRYLAIRTLGAYFLDELIILPGQTLVTTGIYNYLRHPSESGNLCIAIGSALLTGSIAGLILCCCFVFPVVLIRIKREESLLMTHFPEQFTGYVQTVPALIPRW